MNRLITYFLSLLLYALILVPCNLNARYSHKKQRNYEPKSIIGYQESQNPKRNRQYMNERLALIDLRLRNLEENTETPQEALTQLQSKVAQLKSALGISAEIDPYLLLGPIARTAYEKEQRTLQRAEQKYGAEGRRMIAKKEKLEKEIANINKKLATTKSHLNQRRKRS